MNWNRFIFTENGSSLVEALIAMSLLLVVLIPATIMVTYSANSTIIEDKIEGFTIARNEMEQMLAVENDSSFTKLVQDKWWIKRSVEQEENLYHLKVEVFKSDTTNQPLVKLETSRIWYKED